MASVNKAILIGHLGADPEVRYTPTGIPVATMSVATNRVWKSKDGEKQEEVDWHRVVVWSKQAEACKKYLEKGRAVYVEGRLQTRQYEDKDGVKRYITEVVAERVQFLGSGRGQAENGGQPPTDEEPPEHSDDDVPF